MPITVKLKDIIDALEEAGDSVKHYLDKRTGKIEIISDDITAGMNLENDEFDLDDELEDDAVQPAGLLEETAKAREILDDEGENFIQLPDNFEIHDYAIMEDFSRHYPNNKVSLMLMDTIKGSGAFRRFNNLVRNLGIEKDWYEFRNQTYEQIAIDWLEDHKIPYTRDDDSGLDRFDPGRSE